MMMSRSSHTFLTPPRKDIEEAISSATNSALLSTHHLNFRR